MRKAKCDSSGQYTVTDRACSERSVLDSGREKDKCEKGGAREGEVWAMKVAAAATGAAAGARRRRVAPARAQIAV